MRLSDRLRKFSINSLHGFNDREEEVDEKCRRSSAPTKEIVTVSEEPMDNDDMDNMTPTEDGHPKTFSWFKEQIVRRMRHSRSEKTRSASIRSAESSGEWSSTDSQGDPTDVQDLDSTFGIEDRLRPPVSGMKTSPTSPELTKITSTILSHDQVKQVAESLPPRCMACPWRMRYSTHRDGYSLATLYREVSQTESPCLIIVKDTRGGIFGALTSDAPRVSSHYYGTGETFLFTFYQNEYLTFKWTGENDHFIQGDNNALCIGASNGQYGLYLDSDLYHGRTYPCETFANMKLTKPEDFIIDAVEVWSFD